MFGMGKYLGCYFAKGESCNFIDRQYFIFSVSGFIQSFNLLQKSFAFLRPLL